MNILKTICLVAIGMIAMSSGCEKSETISPDCDISYDCKDLQVLEEIKDEEVVVGSISGSYALFRNEGAVSDENILVPCKNLPQNFKVLGKILIVSGNRMNCCELLSYPTVKPGFGCLFIVSSIKEKRN